MYSSDLYSQDDIVSTVPPYEIEPHGIIVASEEVVYSSPDKRTIENDTVTRNYSIVGGGGCETDRNGFLSSRMDLKVAVIRKIGFGSANSNPWFPKKVIVTTSKRRIETVAWAHSSDNLTSRLKSTSPVGHIEDDARDSPAMDSDPSLSSINATAFHASQLSSPPSSSSADCTGGFQMSHISIEPDIETDPFSRRCQPFNCSDVDDSHKTSIDNGKFSVGIQHFKIPLRIYPGTTRNKLLSPTQRLHSAELPCPVKDCGSILRTPAALRKHALVHAERKFVCNQCGKGFAERTKLNRHMLTHTGEKAFKCKHDGCNKAFSLEANLKSHMKTHTGEKSYKCSYCNHAFTHPYNLRVHISRRHKSVDSA